MPINSNCKEDKQDNLDANDLFLTKTIRRNITVRMLETRESKARSTTPVGKSSRGRRTRLLQRERLQ